MEESSALVQVNQLKQILKQEIIILEEIKSIETEKNFLLTSKKSIVDLTPQNERVEVLLKNQALYERNRERILNELSLYYRTDPLTLQNLIDKIPEKDKEEIIVIRMTLQLLLDEIKDINDVNKIILNDLIKLVGYTLDLYTKENSLALSYSDKPNSLSKNNNCKPLVLDTVI